MLSHSSAVNNYRELLAKHHAHEGEIATENPGDGRLPAPLIAIDSMNIRTLAAYLLGPDELGLRYKLTFNEQHYIDGENGKTGRFGGVGAHGDADPRAGPPLAAAPR